MPRQLSQQPRQARKRLRRVARSMAEDVKLIYEKPISEWDFEELCACRPKDENGKFRMGPPETWLTDIVRGEIYNRLQAVTRQRLGNHTLTAIKTIMAIMRDDSEDSDGRPIVPPGVKLDAAKYLLNQLIGSPSSKVEITGKLDLNHLLARIMVNPDGQDAHPTTVEGTVEELSYEAEE